MTTEQIAKLKEEMLEIIHNMSDEELQEDLNTYLRDRGIPLEEQEAAAKEEQEMECPDILVKRDSISSYLEVWQGLSNIPVEVKFYVNNRSKAKETPLFAVMEVKSATGPLFVFAGMNSSSMSTIRAKKGFEEFINAAINTFQSNDSKYDDKTRNLRIESLEKPCQLLYFHESGRPAKISDPKANDEILRSIGDSIKSSTCKNGKLKVVPKIAFA